MRAGSASFAALLRVDFLRLRRDPKCAVMYMVIVGVPLVPTILGGSGMRLQTVMSLFLPVLVAWSWGGDLATGSLTPIALGAVSPRALLGARMLSFAPLTVVANVVTAIASRASAVELLAACAFSVHVLLLGFLLATLFRSAEVGWLPVFIAFVGVSLPIMAAMRNSPTIPLILKWLALLLLPAFAQSLELASRALMLIVHLFASLTWITASMIIVRRAGVMR